MGNETYTASYVEGLWSKQKELETLVDSKSNEIISLTEKLAKARNSNNEAIQYIGELKKFIQHLQDHIAAKHLEENDLIFEKFIQEETTNGSQKESN